MNPLALAFFVAAPAIEPPAGAHEKVLQARGQPLATATLPENIWRNEGGNGVRAQSTLACPPNAGDFRCSALQT